MGKKTVDTVKGIEPSSKWTVESALKRFVQGFRRNLSACIPVCVWNTDDYQETGMISVIPLLKPYMTVKEETFDSKKIKPFHVHIKRLQSGGFAMQKPVYVGDTGWVISSDKDTEILLNSNASCALADNMSYQDILNKQLQNQDTLADHSINDGYFIADSWRGRNNFEEGFRSLPNNNPWFWPLSLHTSVPSLYDDDVSLKSYKLLTEGDNEGLYEIKEEGTYENEWKKLTEENKAYEEQHFFSMGVMSYAQNYWRIFHSTPLVPWKNFLKEQKIKVSELDWKSERIPEVGVIVLPNNSPYIEKSKVIGKEAIIQIDPFLHDFSISSAKPCLLPIEYKSKVNNNQKTKKYYFSSTGAGISVENTTIKSSVGAGGGRFHLGQEGITLYAGSEVVDVESPATTKSGATKMSVGKNIYINTNGTKKINIHIKGHLKVNGRVFAKNYIFMDAGGKTIKKVKDGEGTLAYNPLTYEDYKTLYPEEASQMKDKGYIPWGPCMGFRVYEV